MALSLGVAKTGLGEALASWLQSRLSQRPFFLLCQLHLIGLVTAFLIPSGVIRVLFFTADWHRSRRALTHSPIAASQGRGPALLALQYVFWWLWTFDRLRAQS